MPRVFADVIYGDISSCPDPNKKWKYTVLGTACLVGTGLLIRRMPVARRQQYLDKVRTFYKK